MQLYRSAEGAAPPKCRICSAGSQSGTDGGLLKPAVGLSGVFSASQSGPAAHVCSFPSLASTARPFDVAQGRLWGTPVLAVRS